MFKIDKYLVIIFVVAFGGAKRDYNIKVKLVSLESFARYYKKYLSREKLASKQ